MRIRPVESRCTFALANSKLIFTHRQIFRRRLGKSYRPSPDGGAERRNLLYSLNLNPLNSAGFRWTSVQVDNGMSLKHK